MAIYIFMLYINYLFEISTYSKPSEKAIRSHFFSLLYTRQLCIVYRELKNKLIKVPRQLIFLI